VNYERLYEYRFRDVAQANRKAVWDVIAADVYERLDRPQRVLDPAAGRGESIDAIPATERWAIDVVNHRGGSAQAGTKFIEGDVMDVDLPEGHFDAVWVSNFLEHLSTQEQVATFLEKVRECIRPGGVVAVMGPNFRFCADRYFDAADHRLALTDVAVEEHIYAAGFEIAEVIPRFLPHSFSGRLPSSARLARLYLRLPIVWRLLGEQFLILGRRPFITPPSSNDVTYHERHSLERIAD
jgi:2-polyprenyl-3-methyl-5-hydroxy-6-metoxy-1,4-benzoquinol methylase